MGREVSYRAGGRGRDGPRSRGRGGRGRGSRDNKPRSSTVSSKTPEMKFVPHGIGKDRLTASYQTVKDYVVQVVQKTFKNGKDVADSLREMQVMDMETKCPVRKVSRETDPELKEQEQWGFNVRHKSEMDLYTKRRQEFEDNL
jgi:hypothetical protein